MPIAGPYTASIILCDPSTECFLKKKKKYIHIAVKDSKVATFELQISRKFSFKKTLKAQNCIN